MQTQRFCFPSRSSSSAALSLSLFCFEKPPMPSQLDNVTTSEDLFFGALPPPIGSLCVLPRPFAGGPFSRDFVPHRQTSSSASNIPFRIKLQSRQSHHHSLSPGRRKRLNFESAIPAKESTITAIEPQRILPRLSTIETSPATASHGFGSRLCHCDSASQGPSGTFRFVGPPRPGVH